MTVAMRLTLGVIVFSSIAGLADGQESQRQETAINESEVLHQLGDLRQALIDLRAELSETRHESQELRRDLDAARRQLAEMRCSSPVPPAAADGATEAPVSEKQQMIETKVNDLSQAKVGSGSMYRVRRAGIALFNATTTRGAVDQIDMPLIAKPVAPRNRTRQHSGDRPPAADHTGSLRSELEWRSHEW